MTLDFCNVLIISGLTKPPKMGVFAANGPVADFRANFQHIDCPHSWQPKTVDIFSLRQPILPLQLLQRSLGRRPNRKLSMLSPRWGVTKVVKVVWVVWVVLNLTMPTVLGCQESGQSICWKWAWKSATGPLAEKTPIFGGFVNPLIINTLQKIKAKRPFFVYFFACYRCLMAVL